MKGSKLVLTISVVCSLCATPAFAAHFTVGGSENGSFTITGTLLFGHVTATGAPETILPDNQNDIDIPADGGTPITILPDNSINNYYPCPVTMEGSVVNGVASITSMRVTPDSIVCERISQSAYNLPWRIHALSPAYATAMVKGVTFYSAGTFSCANTTAMVRLIDGVADFQPVSAGGCYIQSYTGPLTVTPSVDVAYP